MIDTTQILLFTVVTSLTVLLIIIGIQLFFILREIRRMLQKTNKMMEDASHVTGSISRSFHEVSGFAEGIKTVFRIFGKLGNKGDKKSHE